MTGLLGAATEALARKRAEEQQILDEMNGVAPPAPAAVTGTSFAQALTGTPQPVADPYAAAIQNIIAHRQAGGQVNIPEDLDKNKLLYSLASTLAARRQPGEVSQGSPLQVAGEGGAVTWNR